MANHEPTVDSQPASREETANDVENAGELYQGQSASRTNREKNSTNASRLLVGDSNTWVTKKQFACQMRGNLALKLKISLKLTV